MSSHWDRELYLCIWEQTHQRVRCRQATIIVARCPVLLPRDLRLLLARVVWGTRHAREWCRAEERTAKRRVVVELTDFIG